MMKHLIVFCAVVLCPLQAMAAQSSASAKAIFDSMQKYCIGALKAGQETQAFATQNKLAALPQQDAQKFSPDGGQVYPLPGLQGQAVLTTNPKFKTVCSIAIHKTDIGAFKDMLYKNFGTAKGYKLVREKRDEPQRITKTEFSGNINGAVKVLVTASDIPRPNGIQILMTIGRAGE